MRLIDSEQIRYERNAITGTLQSPKCWVDDTPTVFAIPMERIKQLREEIEQLKLVGYATVDGKRQIASRAVFDLLDNMIKEYSE